MIEPKRQDFILYQGATWEHTYSVIDDLGVIVTLSGCTALLTAREDVADATPVLEVTGMIDAPKGLVQFVITPDMTWLQTWEKAGFDAELLWTGGRTDKLSYGTFKLVQEFTRV